MKRWVWRHIELCLPEDWEMLRYSRDPDAGQCLFADRHQIRMEISWRKVPGAPDFDRMLGDYMARICEVAKEDINPKRTTGPAGWHGIHVPAAEGHSRFGTFLEEASLLVELVLFWPGKKRDETTMQAILKSVRIAKPTANGLRRWEASGLACAVEPQLQLKACAFEPARAEWVFANPKRETLIRRFRRLGMVDSWLKGTIEDWLTQTLMRDVKVGERFIRQQDGHTIYHLTGKRRRRRMTMFGDRWMHLAAAAWRCPQDDRIYYSCVEYPSRAREKYQHPERMLACCHAWKAGEAP